MPQKTTFLSLTLPEFQEFIDSWHDPVNQNMEDLDAFLEDLHNALVDTSATGTWAPLRGSLGSLADRLDVSINTDGTIKIGSSPDILALSSSSTNGTEASPDDDPRGRFDRSDFEIYDARQPFVGGRFTPFGGTGPSAGFPEEELDAGIAARVADFGAFTETNGVGPVSSPQRPAAPGLVAGGAPTFISAPGGDRILSLDGSGATAVFNIDGYMFRIREQVDIDLTPAGFTDTNYVWVYVERVGANYGSTFLYNQDGGYAVKDLRILQNGTAGSTSTSTFTDAAALFNTAVLGKVRPGDVLVIDDTTAAGKYVIDSVDSDIQVTIRGTFKANVTAAADWHVQDDHQPNIGAAEGGADPEEMPPFVPGRVYIGRARYAAASFPTEVITFARGGVYDSGWQSVTAAGLFGTPLVLSHDLGVPPTSVDIFVRSAANAPTYQPILERRFMTDFNPANLPGAIVIGDFIFHTQLVPSVRWHSTTEDITVRLLNAQTGNLTPVAAALFTDSAGTDITSGEMRVVCKR